MLSCRHPISGFWRVNGLDEGLVIHRGLGSSQALVILEDRRLELVRHVRLEVGNKHGLG